MAAAQLLAPVADTNRLPLPAMGGRFAPVQQFVRQPAVQRALPAIATTTAIGLAALAYFMTQSAPQAQLFAGLDDSDKAAVADALQSQGIGHTTVSYTHLDVYKRQVRKRSSKACDCSAVSASRSTNCATNIRTSRCRRDGSPSTICTIW